MVHEEYFCKYKPFTVAMYVNGYLLYVDIPTTPINQHLKVQWRDLDKSTQVDVAIVVPYHTAAQSSMSVNDEFSAICAREEVWQRST